MKHANRNAVSLIVIVTLFALALAPQPARTQTQPSQSASPKYALLEFLKIEPGKRAEALNSERGIWMPFHRERVKMGLIKSWSLWGVQFPGGVSREYDLVTITTFDKFADVENAYPPELFKRVDPNLTTEELVARTAATHKTVRTEYVTMLDSTTPTASTAQPKIAYIGYMKPEPGGGYANLERRFWKPLHQERVNRGILRSWTLYQVRFPAGTEKEYTFFTIQLYDKFEHLETQYPAGIWEKVHPNVKEDDIGMRTNAARKMVRTEVLNLLDQAQ